MRFRVFVFEDTVPEQEYNAYFIYNLSFYKSRRFDSFLGDYLLVFAFQGKSLCYAEIM